MQEIATDMMLNGPVFQRRSALFHKYQAEIYCRTDGLFAKLMVLQWLAGIAAAFWISPKTWSGASSQTHWHVWAAIFLGGAISSFPVLLAWRQPGRILTRHTIAVAQMLTSALLIHLTGGRIETHFHVFGSLAFLAFYRDWRVLISATVVVAADHFLRGVYWPQSVYGVLVASPWRWFEHAGWVIFEDIFLCISIRQSISEMFEVATRQAKLEGLNEGIERQVTERTAELTATHRQLVEASRQAGMAEVATGVLHNVGNVLNSVNVTVALADEQLKKSRLSDLNRVVALLQEHQGHLASFLTADSKGQKIPDFLKQVAAKLTSEQSSLLNELESLRKNIEHIKDIVAMQQSYAKVSGLAERINVIDLVEDSLRLNAAALVRHNVQVIRDYHDVPPISIDKNKVLQILINLVGNAKYACDESGLTHKRMTLRVSKSDHCVRVVVIDNGVGIPPENLNRIFNHGFTTRKDGHGFGLHSGALAARELGGSLRVHSDGPGKGAAFTLELPLGIGADTALTAMDESQTNGLPLAPRLPKTVAACEEY